MTDLSILMPVHNERSTIERAIEGVLEVDFELDGVELIVVNDGSDDGTEDLLAERKWPARVRMVSHERNMGKGAALKTALSKAQGTWAVIHDADLEYSPHDIKHLLPPLTTGRAQAVFGTRTFSSHAAFSFWYVVGNKAVTLATNILYNSWISDLMTCHKAMRTDLFQSLTLQEHGFGIEAEITARLLREGVSIYEVPIEYVARSRDEGKHLTAIDGLRVLRTLLRCRFA